MGIFDWLWGRKDPQPGWQDRLSSGPVDARLRAAVLFPGRFGKDRFKPAGDWVQTTTVIKVAGVQHRGANAKAFAMAVQRAERDRLPYGVALRPEPENPHDSNAIKVEGVVGNSRWHVGYLDRFAAEEITRDLLSKGIPIEAELYEIWVGEEGYIDIKLLVLAPPGNGIKARLKK